MTGGCTSFEKVVGERAGAEACERVQCVWRALDLRGMVNTRCSHGQPPPKNCLRAAAQLAEERMWRDTGMGNSKLEIGLK